MELEADGLSAWHGASAEGALALHGVSFTVPSGQFGAVLGPSGSGKTTLLRAIAGLHRGVRGRLRLGDDRLDALPPERRGIGLVPQDGALFPQLTVAENIDFGLSRKERKGSRTAEMLELLDLLPLAKRLPHQLSGGQAQRAAVARALAPAPSLVLLDEPFSALDAALRSEVREGVRAALARTGTTALLVTHDQDEALSMADLLIVLAAGRVHQIGTPREVYTCPIDLWTGRFLGEANTVAGRSDGNTVTTPLGVFPQDDLPPGAVTALIRPEQLRLLAPAAAGVSALVQQTRYFGYGGLTELRLDGGETVLARVGADLPAPGTRVGVMVTGPVRIYPGASSTSTRPSAPPPQGTTPDAARS